MQDTEKRPPIKTGEDLYKYFQKTKETCNITAEVKNQNLHLNLASASENVNLVIPVPAALDTTYRDQFNEKRNLTTVSIPYRSQKPGPQGGYIFYNAFYDSKASG